MYSQSSYTYCTILPYITYICIDIVLHIHIRVHCIYMHTVYTWTCSYTYRLRHADTTCTYLYILFILSFLHIHCKICTINELVIANFTNFDSNLNCTEVHLHVFLFLLGWWSFFRMPKKHRFCWIHRPPVYWTHPGKGHQFMDPKVFHEVWSTLSRGSHWGPFYAFPFGNLRRWSFDYGKVSSRPGQKLPGNEGMNRNHVINVASPTGVPFPQHQWVLELSDEVNITDESWFLDVSSSWRDPVVPLPWLWKSG